MARKEEKPQHVNPENPNRIDGKKQTARWKICRNTTLPLCLRRNGMQEARLWSRRYAVCHSI